MGDIMRKIFVLAMATAALCPLAISAEPALGFEFDSETALPSLVSSSTPLVIQLGASGWVECSSIELKTSPALGPQTELKVKMEGESFCSYEDNTKMVGELILSSGVEPPKCPLVLESAKLEELSAKLFNEGLAELNCELKITTTAGCKITIEHGTFAREYEWDNLTTTLGNYESLLKLELKHLTYKISSGCGSNGTSGEFKVSLPVKHVIVI
jgi:hypothetical protein